MPKCGTDDQPHPRATGGPADEITFRTPAPKRGTNRRPVARRRDVNSRPAARAHGHAADQPTKLLSEHLQRPCQNSERTDDQLHAGATAGGGPADEITFRTPATPMPKLGADRRPVARRRNGEPSTSRTRARSRGGPADEITFRTPPTADADRADQLHAGATSNSRPAARERPRRGGPTDEITFRTPTSAETEQTDQLDSAERSGGPKDRKDRDDGQTDSPRSRAPRAHHERTARTPRTPRALRDSATPPAPEDGPTDNQRNHAPRTHHERTTNAPRTHGENTENTTRAPRLRDSARAGGRADRQPAQPRTTSAPRAHHERTTNAPRTRRADQRASGTARPRRPRSDRRAPIPARTSSLGRFSRPRRPARDRGRRTVAPSLRRTGGRSPRHRATADRAHPRADQHLRRPAARRAS